jgi:CHRD domain
MKHSYKMVALILGTVSLLAGCGSLPPAQPYEMSYETYLTGANEVPPHTTDMVGDFKLKLNRSFTLNIKNVDNDKQKPTAAHIHCGKLGVAGPVVYGIFSNPYIVGNTLSYSSSIDDRKFSVNPKTDACPFVIDSMDKLQEAIAKGYIYVNVHTAAKPAGIIRGQLAKQ